MRSDQIKRGIERAPHRALLKATGVTDTDMNKPFIAIVNSYVDVVPGHVHLESFAATLTYKLPITCYQYAVGMGDDQ